MFDYRVFNKKRLVYKDLSEPDALILSVKEDGLHKSTDDLFIAEALRGANTIDAQIDRLDRLIDSTAGKGLRAGVLATLGVSGAYLGAGMFKGATVAGAGSVSEVAAATSALSKGAVMGTASGAPLTSSISSSIINSVNAVVADLTTVPSAVATSSGASTISTGAVAGSSISTLGAVLGGAAPVVGGYLLYKGAQWAIDRERHDEALNPVISRMEAGISLKHDTIEKTGAWNALKKFIGGESKISIETYARIVEHELIVDKLIKKREELHAKKLAEMERARKIRRGWATRAKGWITDKFETNKELKQYNKTRKVLARESERVFKRKEKLETQINKTKDRFEQKNKEYDLQVIERLNRIKEMMGIDILDADGWINQLVLEPGALPDKFDVGGVEYGDLDEFISKYPNFVPVQRSALRSALKELRRIIRKIKKFTDKFGAKNFDKFTQRFSTEYVSEKRDVAYKIDNLAQNLGHNVSISKVPAELSAKFPTMTLPIKGVIKSTTNGFIEIVSTNPRGEEFIIRMPTKYAVASEKEFSVSMKLPDGRKMAEKFSLSLLNDTGILIEGLNLDSPIEQYQNELISVMDNLVEREYHTLNININPVLRNILSRKLKFSSKDMKNIGKFKVSGLSKKGTPGTPGKIVLECLPNGSSNPAVILEIDLSPDNKIDKSKKIKVKKIEPVRAISSPTYEAELSFEEFIPKNNNPKLETDKKYADFTMLREYILDATNLHKEITPHNVPNDVASEYFAITSTVYNYGTLGNLKIETSGPDKKLVSREFEIEIPTEIKANTELTVKLRTATATAPATATAATPAPATATAATPEAKIKAIDLVDFDLHHI